MMTVVVIDRWIWGIFLFFKRVASAITFEKTITLDLPSLR